VKCALLGWMAFKAALAEASASDDALAQASHNGNSMEVDDERNSRTG
jgi:nitrogen fixation NifU-like protein